MKYAPRNLLLAVAGLLSLMLMGATYKPKVDPVDESYGKFNIIPEYDLEKAYAGGSLTLSIKIVTPGASTLKLVKCESPDPSIIQIMPMNDRPEPLREGDLSTTRYLFDINIAGKPPGGQGVGAEPRIYKLKLHLQHPGKSVVYRFVDLNVGVRSKGKLIVKNDVEDDGPEDATGKTETPEFYSGTENTYVLNLYNDYVDYSVNIHKIEIRSHPSELIDAPRNIQEIVFTETPLSLKPNESRTLPVEFKLKGMSFSHLIAGFSEHSTLNFIIYYDDSHERTISDLRHKARIKVKPRDRVLVIWMLIGVAVGTVIKFYLQRLQRQGVISRRDLLWFVFITVMVGLVVSIVALVGRVRIIAFEQTGSYDKPMVIFIIGLAGAVGGAQLLYGWVKSLVPQATGDDRALRPQKTETRREP